MKDTEPKQYRIKIPVYVSELIDKPFDLFGGITAQHMISSIKSKLDDYNNNRGEIKNAKRNKTFEKHIKGINYQEVMIGQVKSLLLKVTAFTTNYQDGFFEKERKIEFTKDSKIGSDNNFILIYPNIYGLDPNNYRYQWIILLYEDPNKENADIVNTAKLVLKKILKIEVKNIKLSTVIESLKENEATPLVALKFITLDFDPDDEIPKFKYYLVSQKVKTINELVYEDLPSENAIELISPEDNLLKKGFQAIKRFLLGKKEFRVTQTYEEATERIKEVVEEIYNSDTIITEEDLQKNVYETNFVIDKFKPVLSEYLNNNNEE
ncbi:MAG: hypothetical protein MUF43_14650 [Flavobacterium sp.]|jgi:hypothetical protein|nr:hypothetical protein [Flavobacterium sp.]